MKIYLSRITDYFLCPTGALKSHLLILFLLVLIQGCAGKQTQGHAPGQDFSIFFAENMEAPFWPDSRLECSFIRYWGYRFMQGQAHELFQMEAPHFQVMAGFDRYRLYIRNLPKGSISSINIHNIETISENLIHVLMTLDYTDEGGQDRSFGLRDRWVMVDEKWFHLAKDPLFFPGI